MKAEFIEAAMLFRLFMGIDGLDDENEQWGIVLAMNRSTKAGDLEALLRRRCGDVLANIEVFEDTERWIRYLIEKHQISKANNKLQERLHNQVVKDFTLQLRLEQRSERHIGTLFKTFYRLLILSCKAFLFLFLFFNVIFFLSFSPKSRNCNG